MQSTQSQVKTFRRDYMKHGKPETIIAQFRWDDSCGNGHNTFAVTGEIYTVQRQPDEKTVVNDGRTLYLTSCGQIPEDIAKHFPMLVPLLKWHLCSSEGPLHYIANTCHHADDRDYNGLRAGEIRQNRDPAGLPMWQLLMPQITQASGKKPEAVTLEWQPCVKRGTGKPRDLDAARRTAIWPDATDEDLTAPGLAERLAARLPGLLVELRAAVESLGFEW